MQLNDLAAQLPDIARKVALPALVGGAGGGALAGYMSSKNRPANEDPGQRRRRILRNALVGVLLGGTAGATAPLGASMLGGELLGQSKTVDPTGSALAFGARNALPLGVGAFGAHRLHRAIGQERGNAMKMLVGQLGDSTIGKTRVRNEAALRQILEGGGRNEVLKELARVGKGHSVERLFKGHELLGEAGYKGDVVGDLLKRKSPGNFWGSFKPNVDMTAAIAKHLEGTSSLPGKLKSFSPAGLVARRVGQNPGLAEAYLKHIRPSASRMMGRLGTPTRAAGLLGVVLLAKKLQDAALGQN